MYSIEEGCFSFFNSGSVVSDPFRDHHKNQRDCFTAMIIRYQQNQRIYRHDDINYLFISDTHLQPRVVEIEPRKQELPKPRLFFKFNKQCTFKRKRLLLSKKRNLNVFNVV
jgi:hypothetical protein